MRVLNSIAKLAQAPHLSYSLIFLITYPTTLVLPVRFAVVKVIVVFRIIIHCHMFMFT
jgi:hypothetical protein